MKALLTILLVTMMWVACKSPTSIPVTCVTNLSSTKIVQTDLQEMKSLSATDLLLQENNDEESHQLLDEVIIVRHKVPLIEMDNTTSGATISYSSAKDKIDNKKRPSDKRSLTALPSKNSVTLGSKTETSEISKGTITVHSGRNALTFYYIDGVKVSGAEAAKKLIENKVTTSNHETDALTPATDEIKTQSGQLTASEWNDLYNWDDWNRLITDGVYVSMLDYWQLPMGKRHSVFVTNEANIPLPNCYVELFDSNETIVWSAVTDHTGKAELWQPSTATSEIKLSVTKGGAYKEVRLSPEKSQDDKHIILPIACNPLYDMDIMFVIDATGSIQDEIAYLKSELQDVVLRTSLSDSFSIRTGAVFYKDKWDDFLTKVSDLNYDTEATISFLGNHIIGGGGDYPEAMDAGLDKALEQEWNMEALNRIIFLVLDAPPHDDAEVMERLASQVRRAAMQGIKLVPITASGINRETEYLMKQMAMMTNGTYVFLTDDSGIGDTHLVHAIPDYDVEPLNDLLVRLIQNFGRQISCTSDIVENEIADNFKSPSKVDFKVYPNPASLNIAIEVTGRIDKVIIYSSTGKRVRQVDSEVETLSQIDVHDLVSGMYTVVIEREGQRLGRQSLIIVR